MRPESSIERVSCDEIAKISLEKDATNPIVAFIVRPFFMHPKFGFTSLAIQEKKSFPENIVAKFIYNDSPECPGELGMSYIKDRVRVFLPGGQKEDISLNMDKFS